MRPSGVGHLVKSVLVRSGTGLRPLLSVKVQALRARPILGVRCLLLLSVAWLAATPRLLRSRLINPPLRSPVERTVRSSANIPASEGPAVVQEPAEAVPAGAGTAPTDVSAPTELPAQAEASPNAHELVLESSGESDVDEKTDAKRPRNAPARLADEARPPKKRKVVAAAAAPAAEAKAKQAKPKPSKPKPRGGALNRDGQPYKPQARPLQPGY